jgi:hypothetical protein
MKGSFLRFVTAASLLIGLFPSNLTSQQTTTRPPSPEEAKAQKNWRTSMAKVPLPKKGCFRSAYPSLQWSEIQCVTPPPYPQVPRRGPRPLVGGGGNDVAAQAPSGTISSATGSFDTVTNVTSEAGQLGGVGNQVTDAYTYQLNTNRFFGSPACGNAADPMACQGWEQFIFANNGTGNTGNAFIQYWLISYNKPCPGGWAPFAYPGPTDTSCWRNSTFGAPLPSQTISNMLQTSLTGTISATSDTVNYIGGGQSYAMGDNSLNAATGWTIAEFAVVGNGNSGQANFNDGASYVSRTTIAYGGTAPPICVATGFTGETNNLSFGPGAPAASGTGPALIFTESTAGGATANCMAATSIGDTHLTTVKSLLYDFQASGDFVVAQLDPDFAVQARQVNGAPNWPNATLNKAIATRMGKSTVALCLAPERLVVDGKIADIPQSGVLELPDGVDITRRRNVYFITSPSGDSVRATVNPSPGWIDMSVGFGHWPATVKGLLANANDNMNQLAASDGTVLTNAFPFDDLYHHYADSWRVSRGTSLLSACGGATESGAPSATFYASNLDPQVRERTRAVCATAGVTEPAFLDACTADVAMTGNDAAAKVFVGMPAPAAVGKIVISPAGAAAVGGPYGRYFWWLLLLLILIVIIVWLILKKR